MKTTDHFKKTIQAYLEQRAASDAMFEWVYTNTKKNIDYCITYILNTVQQSGCNGFTDDEIFGMAVHYYDEENIEIGNPINCNVVVNHTVELTEEDKEQARKDAIARLYNEEYAKQKQSQKKPTKQPIQQPMLSLFDQ